MWRQKWHSQSAASEWESPWKLSRSFMEIPSAYAVLLYCRLLSGFSFFNKRKQGTFYVSITRELGYICCNPLEVRQQFALYWGVECFWWCIYVFCVICPIMWCTFLKIGSVYTFCIWKTAALWFSDSTLPPIFLKIKWNNYLLWICVLSILVLRQA